MQAHGVPSELQESATEPRTSVKYLRAIRAQPRSTNEFQARDFELGGITGRMAVSPRPEQISTFLGHVFQEVVS